MVLIRTRETDVRGEVDADAGRVGPWVRAVTKKKRKRNKIFMNDKRG